MMKQQQQQQQGGSSNGLGFGLEVGDIDFRTNIRVFVKSIRSGSYAESLGMQPGWIATRINDIDTERTNARGYAQYLRSTSTTSTSPMSDNGGDTTIILTFRDPSIFQKQLNNLSGNNEISNVVTTKIAPGGDTTQYPVQNGRSIVNNDGNNIVRTEQTDQYLSVKQLVPPSNKLCQSNGTGGAKVDDLLEISYVGRIVETGQIFDGSAVSMGNGSNNGIPGRGNDMTIYFVLGKQPFGQFSVGWDVGLNGICVGERRQLFIPPALGYGSMGVPRRNIPPNATLQYDITLVSLNGIAQ